LKLGANPVLTFQAGVDPGRAWELEVYANNKRMALRTIDGSSKRSGDRIWGSVRVDLSEFANQQVQLRLYQRVLLADKIPGNAYWKALQIE
jgi:hypothetical protein